MKRWLRKVLSIVANILVSILDVVGFSVYDCFSLIFDNIFMERTWIRPTVHLILRRGYKDVPGGGEEAEILCMCSGL